MTKPAAELQPASRFEWERIVRRCLIPGPVKLVAFVLAQYGNAKGEEIRPGFPRLASTCVMGESTARRHVDTLLSIGLVQKLSHGGGRNGVAARYRLTIPEDLLERVEMLAPDEQTKPIPGGKDGFYSAHVLSGVADGYSAQSEALLRSSGGSTPLTWVSTYQGTTQTPPRNRAPEASTSPARDPTEPQPDPPADPDTERHRQQRALREWMAAHPNTQEAS